LYCLQGIVAGTIGFTAIHQCSCLCLSNGIYFGKEGLHNIIAYIMKQDEVKGIVLTILLWFTIVATAVIILASRLKILFM